MEALTLAREVPPNHEKICAAFAGVRDHKGAIFTYGDKIYAPNLAEESSLAAHHIVHESVHQRQQAAIGGPEVWWDNFIADPNFRAQQELEAYRAQYNFVKNIHGGRVLEDFLFQLSCDLSGPMYGNLMSYGRAESNIRRTV